MALLAEDLLLLLLDDRRGSLLVDSTSADSALAGAVLLELALEGRIDVAGEGSSVKKGRLYALDRDPLGDPVLDRALARIAVEQRKPESWVPKLAKGLRQDMLRRAQDDGAVSASEDTVLGVFHRTRYPQADGTGEHDLVLELKAALDGAEPAPRAAALIALLSAVDVVHKAVPGVEKKQARTRAREISEGNWAADAVTAAVRAVFTAVAGAVAASVVVSAS